MSTSQRPDASPGEANTGEEPALRRRARRRSSTALRQGRGLVRARLAVSLLSIIYGVMVGGWSARVPDIRAGSGADNATWGLANSLEVAIAIGALAAVVALAGRLPPRILALTGAITLLVDAPLAAAAPNVRLLIAGMMVWACAGVLLEAPAKALQLDVQQRYRRPVLGSFGACWSFGSFAGAGLGILAAAVGVSPGIQLGTCTAVLAVLLLLTHRWLPTPQPGPADRTPGFLTWARRRITPQLLLLITITFLTSYVASAGEQWSAIYVSDTLRAGAALGAGTYTVWVLASAAGLLVVDRLATRVGLLRLFRLSIPVGAAGLAAGLCVNTPVAAIAGFAILGVCSASVGPVIATLAGQQPQLAAAEGISAVQLGEPPGFLISPLLIGSVATAIGLRLALATTVISLITAASLATALRTTQNTTPTSPTP